MPHAEIPSNSGSIACRRDLPRLRGAARAGAPLFDPVPDTGAGGLPASRAPVGAGPARKLDPRRGSPLLADGPGTRRHRSPVARPMAGMGAQCGEPPGIAADPARVLPDLRALLRGLCLSRPAVLARPTRARPPDDAVSHRGHAGVRLPLRRAIRGDPLPRPLPHVARTVVDGRRAGPGRGDADRGHRGRARLYPGARRVPALAAGGYSSGASATRAGAGARSLLLVGIPPHRQPARADPGPQLLRRRAVGRGVTWCMACGEHERGARRSASASAIHPCCLGEHTAPIGPHTVQPHGRTAPDAATLHRSEAP